MSNIENDTKISKIVKSLPKADRGRRIKILNAFNKYIKDHSIQSPVKETLSQGFFLLRDFKHEEKRHSPEEYAEVIRMLIDYGYPLYASALFANSFSCIKDLPEYITTCILPTVKDIKIWIKELGIEKKELLEKISSNPERYYDSVLFDWACKAAPITSVRPFVHFLLLDKTRFGDLAEANDLLSTIISRDRKGALCADLLPEADHSKEILLRLINVVSGLPVTWRVWSDAFSDYLIKTEECQADSILVESLLEYFASPIKERAMFFTKFPAHLLTTISILWEPKNELDKNRMTAIINKLIQTILNNPREVDKNPTWVAGPASTVADVLMTGKTALTLHGARQVAQGLNALDSNPKPADLFRAVAMNLGLTQIGNAGDVKDYDPGLHEDLQGGILPGEPIRVSKTGWAYEGTVILRAQVIRNSGGEACTDQQ